MAVDPMQGMSSQMASFQANMAGQESMTQMRLCGWLPNLDVKSPFTIQEMAALGFLNKTAMPGQKGILDTLLPNSASPVARLLDKLFAAFGKGNAIQNQAGDLIPADLRQMMASYEIYGQDADNMRAMIGSMSAQANIAMNRAALGLDDGPGIG